MVHLVAWRKVSGRFPWQRGSSLNSNPVNQFEPLLLLFFRDLLLLLLRRMASPISFDFKPRNWTQLKTFKSYCSSNEFMSLNYCFDRGHKNVSRSLIYQLSPRKHEAFFDADPTLKQHWVNASCLLGTCSSDVLRRKIRRLASIMCMKLIVSDKLL